MKQSFNLKTVLCLTILLSMTALYNDIFAQYEYTLPDPLVMENGQPVDSVYKWEQIRRAEILNLFEQNQHGVTPTDSINYIFEVVEECDSVMSGKAKRKQIRIKFPDNPSMEDIRVCICVPANATGPVPTLLHISFSPNYLHYQDDGIDIDSTWSGQNRVPDSDGLKLYDIFPEYLVERGYGIATVCYSDIEPDFEHAGIYGVTSMFPHNSPRLSNEWGSIGAWAWGLSRIMDYFETETWVDENQVALSGVSRLGKTTLWTTAQDERFAMAVPIVAGEGGDAISRRPVGEDIAMLTDPNRYDYWYAPHYNDYAANPDTLPVDAHMLLSLIAPRYLLQVVGIGDTGSDPEGEWLAGIAAEPVFALYGIGGHGQKEYIDPEKPILGHMGFYMHKEGHTVTLKDYKVIADYMDLHFTNQAISDSVIVTEDATTYTLSNKTLTVKVSKTSGDLTSMVYKGVETLTNVSGHPYVYWSHDMTNADTVITSITINPDDNNGDMAEVSIKGISNGNLMGFGPGAPAEGDLAVDIEIRYTLAKGDQGVYTYCIFEHQPEYPAGDFTEARIAAKLKPSFDHIHVDKDRDGAYPLFNEGIDKYVYIALQSENKAYGFTDPDGQLGWFMIVPSTEFLSRGPLTAEFLCHGEYPTVLCYWRSSHYSDANITIADGEEWSRVVGPLKLFVNEGKSSDEMLEDAKRQLAKEEEQWPYAWVQAEAYTPKEKRSIVTGKLALNDSLDTSGKSLDGKLYVGLTKTPYTVSTANGDITINWPFDGKFYQYWDVSENTKGSFEIKNVPAGTYTLYALSDSVLGEYSKSNIIVPESDTIELGDLSWTPVRNGWQVWDIGISNRTATEFAGGDSYFIPGPPLRYAEEFPDDIKYIIGESDYSKDWYYAHMPHANDPSSAITPFYGVTGEGLAAPRAIHFGLEGPGTGLAYLRIAVSGTGWNTRINVSVNETAVSPIEFDIIDQAMVVHQVYGVWQEAEVSFDASLLKKGNNTITLTVPAGLLNNGVVYDYIRLESENSLSLVDYLDTIPVKTIENIDALRLNVYPNPANNILYIDYSDDLSGSIHGSIIDITGRKVLSFENYIEGGNTVHSIDISSLEEGNYIILIKNNYNIYQNKISILK